MNFRYILLNGVVTRDVPLDLYIILPISIILGVAFYSIINSLKLNDMLNKLGFSNKKQYEAFKSSCPLNYKNKFVLSDEWAINEYSHKVYHTDDIINASPVNRQVRHGNIQYGYAYGIMIACKNSSTDSFALSSCKERDQFLKEIITFLSQRTDHIE